jgi:hypothetical protein
LVSAPAQTLLRSPNQPGAEAPGRLA